jgi:hypothetical protein
MWSNTCRQLCCRAVVLVVALLCSGVSFVDAQPRRYLGAVLNLRPTFHPVLAGLREGLVQLGYQEGKNRTFMVENAQGDVASLPNRAARLSRPSPMSFSP